MSFLTPAAFWLSLLLPAVVLLYHLKLRRTEVLVSSTFLWKKALEDMHANAPFQKLVRNLLLYAQLLALAAFVFSLAKPIQAGRAVSGRSVAVLIDTSASMQATDVPPSRLEAARDAALKLVDQMAGRDETMRVAFDATPHVLASLTAEKAQLRAALEALAPSEAAGSAREALLIAASVLRGRPEASIVLLSDGRCQGLDVSLPEGIEVRYLKLGERGLNAGITALDERPMGEDPGRIQLFVETRAVGGIRQGTLRRFLDGGLVDARKVSWEGGKPSSTVFEVRGAPETRLKAVLDVEDDLALDNAAYAVLPGRPRRKVLLVSEGNYFLERLLNLDKGTDLYTIAPKDYAPRLAAGEAGGYALTVLDRWAPERLPEGRYLVLNAVPPLEGFKSLGPAAHPVVLDWKRAHPLMRFANFSNLQVRKCIRWDYPSWVQPLLESSEGPLILLAERAHLRVAVVGFDLFDSDWPFRLSFPVFVSTAVRVLGSGEEGGGRILRPGDAIPWHATARPLPESLSITGPDGVKTALPFGGGEDVTFAGTERTGFYELGDGQDKRVYGVSLRSREESDTTPVPQEEFVLSGKKAASARPALAQRALWPWFAAVALLLLCLEWAMYHRRWL